MVRSHALLFGELLEHLEHTGPAAAVILASDILLREAAVSYLDVCAGGV